jgi:hypothetical protein
MTNLAIGRLNLPDEQAWLALTGSTVMEGLVGSDYQFSPCDENTSRETVQLHLRGSQAQLRQWLNRLEAFQQQPEDLFLRLWSYDLQEYGYACIRQLSLKTLPGHLASHERGSLELDLDILRETFFFGQEVPLSLSNSSGPPLESGLKIYNHDDATVGHDNWFKVDAGNLDLKFPAFLRFQFENNFNGSDLGDFWVGSLPVKLGQPQPKLNLEVEDGSGGTVVSHSQASGGKYCRYSWSGANWQTLTSWVLGPIEVSQLVGGSVLPLLRFFNPPLSANLQVRILVYLQGNLVFEGPVTYHTSGKGYASLDPLRLPLGELPMQSYASHHQLVLQGKQTDAGEHLLELDDLLLLPQHSFVGYHALSGLSYPLKLIEDGMSANSWSLQDGMEFKSHLSFGSGQELKPALLQYFWCFQTDTNSLAPIDRTLSVRAWYRRRWRLP